MNLLILDEPTNHLDLYSKDILLDTLKHFTGTIIFVSHDRAFMEALSTKTLELAPRVSGSPAVARLFYGDYAYYLERLDREAGEGQPEAGETQPKAGEGGIANPAKFPEDDFSDIERRALLKQRQTIIRRLERQEREILKTLEELEAGKATLEAELARPEVYSNGEKAKAVKRKLDETTAAVEHKTREWEAAAEELEQARQ
jgi:ATP-binding cassette subfamily F protein 3